MTATNAKRVWRAAFGSTALSVVSSCGMTTSMPRSWRVPARPAYSTVGLLNLQR